MNAEDPKGVRGTLRLADLFEDGHERQGMALLRKAINQGWVDGFWIDYAEAKKHARELLKSDDDRVRLGAVRTLTVMAEHDLKLIEKMSGGEAPEVQVHEHRHYIVKPPRLLGEG